jgi:flagellar motility protein MotE (MotC chaperone)
LSGARRRPETVRLLPVVVAAAGLLAVLKFAGLSTDGHFALVGVTPATAQDAPAADAGAMPDPDAAGDPVEVDTGNDPDIDQPIIDGTLVEGRRIRLNQPTAPVSEAERALLESLRSRREELDGRAANLEMRENLIKAAEQRVNEKLDALKAFESRIETRYRQQEEIENEQFASLVSMYENMKPKDAARIFNRLETAVLVSVARRMNPRKLGPVMSRMDGATAERLTIEIARAAQSGATPTGELEPLSLN